jgi:WD40 repeat protein
MPQITKLAVNQGHKDAIFALASTQDSKIFFSSGADGFVTSWQADGASDGQLIARVPNSVYAMAVQDNYLLIGHNYDGLHVVDWRKKKEIGTVQLTTKQIFDIKIIGDLAYIGTGEGELIKLNYKTLQVLNRVQLSDKSIRSIAVRPDEQELALAFSDNHIRIVLPETLKVLKDFDAHSNSVFKVAYKNDLLFSGGRDAQLKVWDHQHAYENIFQAPAHMWAINDLAFSPDGEHFVTCSMDKTIKLWDARTFELLKVIDKDRFDSHTSSVNKILWLDTGQVISISDDRAIMLWNIEF